MRLPLVKDVSIVSSFARNFKAVFKNKAQYKHFKDYLSGLIVLENKSLTNISRCTLDCCDKSNLSRFLSNDNWSADQLNQKRIKWALKKTKAHRKSDKESCLAIDDTLCEHVGSLFEYIDLHYNHAKKRYSRAHNPVTSHYISGKVRFPVDFRLYRRYDEFTQWESYVQKYFPQIEIPRGSQKRNRLKRQLQEELLEDSEFRSRHEAFQSKIDLACQLIRSALEQGIPFKVVLFDGWYLCPQIVELLAEYELDYISILKRNRKIETDSFQLYDEEGEEIVFEEKTVQIRELVKKIPKRSFKEVKIGDKSYWCFSISMTLPSLGRVRVVVSYDNKELSGTYALLVTNRLGWESKKIISTYLERWPIETFYRDGKHHLGFNKYQLMSMTSIEKHWVCGFTAYTMLHLLMLGLSKVKGFKRSLQSMGDACRCQAEELIKALVYWVYRRIERGLSIEAAFEILFARQYKPCPSQALATSYFTPNLSPENRNT